MIEVTSRELLNTNSLTNIRTDQQLNNRKEKEVVFKNTMEEQEESSKNSIHLDTLRGKVMQIQEEEKKLQTNLTEKQSLLEFTNNIENKDKWQDELSVYLINKRQKLSLAMSANNDLDSYINKLTLEIENIKRDLYKGQIKSENIFASGLLNSNNLNSSLARDLDVLGQAFGHMRKNNIEQLLKP